MIETDSKIQNKRLSNWYNILAWLMALQSFQTQDKPPEI